MGRRRLGQHFLIRQKVINKIIASLDLSDSDRVLEIGPGHGALTRALSSLPERLLLIEKDASLVTELEATLSGDDQIKILCHDFLKLPWNFIEEFLGDTFKVVSNLPYESSTAILLRLLAEVKTNTKMVLMFQKEVADRIIARPRQKDYGSLSVFCQLLADVTLLAEVPPEAFRPPPRVWSSVLELTLRSDPLVSREQLPNFEKLLRAGFAHRRKMLRQNLKSFFLTGVAIEVESALESVGASVQARAEELSLEQWVQLFSQIQ